MKVKTHVITGFSLGTLLFPVWAIVEKISFLQASIKSLFFFLVTVGMDFDHYIDFMWHSWRRRSGNLTEYLKYVIKTAPVFDETHEKILPNRKDALTFFVFHSFEFLSVLLLVGILIKSELLSAVFMGAFWGATLHVAMDMVHNIRHKMFFRKAWFVTEYCIRKWLMMKKGIDPGKVFQEILDSLDKSST